MSSQCAGIYLDVTALGIATLSNFDKLDSSNFCGSKAISFCHNTGSTPIIVLKCSDILECLSSFEQVIFQSLNKGHGNSQSNSHVIFVVEYASLVDVKEASSILKTFLTRFKSECNIDVTMLSP